VDGLGIFALAVCGERKPCRIAGRVAEDRPILHDKPELAVIGKQWLEIQVGQLAIGALVIDEIYDRDVAFGIAKRWNVRIEGDFADGRLIGRTRLQGGHEAEAGRSRKKTMPVDWNSCHRLSAGTATMVNAEWRLVIPNVQLTTIFSRRSGSCCHGAYSLPGADCSKLDAVNAEPACLQIGFQPGGRRLGLAGRGRIEEEIEHAAWHDHLPDGGEFALRVHPEDVHVEGENLVEFPAAELGRGKLALEDFGFARRDVRGISLGCRGDHFFRSVDGGDLSGSQPFGNA
jgi:hypothetical protein